jgi:hypothetical protein
MDTRNATPRNVKERRDRAVVPSLREAIKAYCAEQKKLDKPALELLNRLDKSPSAAEAFERLKLKDRRAEACVLTACIEAEDIARTFDQRVKNQKDVSMRAKRWNEAVAVLRKFASEVAEKKAPLRVVLAGLDLWSLTIFEPPADEEALTRALDLIASFIEWRRGIAEANIAHLATRKRGIKRAGENAAIGVLAAGVYDAARKPPLTGKPHLRQVADLAEVIFGTAAEVSPERVREVRRKRHQLYLEMFGDQTKRYFDEKSRQARLRSPLIDAVRSNPQKRG